MAGHRADSDGCPFRDADVIWNGMGRAPDSLVAVESVFFELRRDVEAYGGCAVSTYVTVPIDENGIVRFIPPVNYLRVTHDPFRFSDVSVYSHGWWTNAAQAMTDYNHFVVDLTRCLLQIAPAPPSDLALPRSSFPIALHWPSMISETQVLLRMLRNSRPSSQWGSARHCGQHGVSSLVRMLYNDWNPPTSDMKLRLNLIGHSFGCRVVCSGLATALTTIAQEQHRIPSQSS